MNKTQESAENIFELPLSPNPGFATHSALNRSETPYN